MKFDDRSLDDEIRGKAGITVSVKPFGDDEVVIVIDDVEWDEKQKVWRPWCFVTHHGVPFREFDASDLPSEKQAGLGTVVLARLAARFRQLRNEHDDS